MKTRVIVRTAVAAGVILLASCATIMHGTKQRIGISSQPTGASVVVDNVPLGPTPVFANLSRKSEHIVTINMPGYQTAELTVTKKVSGWVWGNIAFGGLIGLAVDAISGGIYNLSPEQLNAELGSTTASTSYSEDGVYVVAALHPDPSWEKIGQLSPQ